MNLFTFTYHDSAGREIAREESEQEDPAGALMASQTGLRARVGDGAATVRVHHGTLTLDGRPVEPPRAPGGDLAAPLPLVLGMLAHSTIHRVLQRYQATYTGGCRGFYTPAEWLARYYGGRPSPVLDSAVLIVVYDGGNLPDFFRMGETYKRHESMRKALEAAGLFALEINNVSSAIYALPPKAAASPKPVGAA